MKIIKLLTINISILILLIEIVSFIFLKMNIFPNGLPPSITLNAHQDYSYWHPKNKRFKIASECWQSDIYFNSLGMKQNHDIKVKKKPRIAILGDSMTENIQLNNEYDFTSKLQKLLPKYEILNFSVASIGLADQIHIYEKLIKEHSPDYLFLYLTENDFTDNTYFDPRPNRISYKIIDNEIVETIRDKKFFTEYFSKINTFKRDKLIHIKKFSNFYKIYWHLKNETFKKRILKKQQKKINLEHKKIIFEKILKDAEIKIFKDVKTFIFLNISNHNNMQISEKRLKMLESLKKYKNFYDPHIPAINYLKEKNQFNHPYFGFKCDSHYSTLGAEFLSNFTYTKFIENNSY